MEAREVNVSEAGGAGGNGLEEAVENTITRGADICYRGVVKLQNLLVGMLVMAASSKEAYVKDNEENEIKAVEDYKDPK